MWVIQGNNQPFYWLADCLTSEKVIKQQLTLQHLHQLDRLNRGSIRP